MNRTYQLGVSNTTSNTHEVFSTDQAGIVLASILCVRSYGDFLLVIHEGTIVLKVKVAHFTPLMICFLVTFKIFGLGEASITVFESARKA